MTKARLRFGHLALWLIWKVSNPKATLKIDRPGLIELSKRHTVIQNRMFPIINMRYYVNYKSMVN